MKKTATKPSTDAKTKPALFALPEKDLQVVCGGRGIVVTGKLNSK